MFTANIYTPLDKGMVLIQLSLEVFTQTLFQKRMQSSKICEEFEVKRTRTRTCKLVLEDPRGQGLSSRTTTLDRISSSRQLHCKWSFTVLTFRGPLMKRHYPSTPPENPWGPTHLPHLMRITDTAALMQPWIAAAASKQFHIISAIHEIISWFFVQFLLTCNSFVSSKSYYYSFLNKKLHNKEVNYRIYNFARNVS